MSKAPSFSPIRYNPNKKVERLYFPQYGDTTLFAQCGRKHYQPSSAFKTPYASYAGEGYSNDLVNSKLLGKDFPHPSKTPSNQRQHEPSTFIKRMQQLSQRQYIPQKEQLEQQIESFNGRRYTYHNEQQERQKQLERQNKTKRVRTENTAYYPDQPVSIPKPPPQISMDYSSKERMKTENDYTPAARGGARFNPTFLSSINY